MTDKSQISARISSIIEQADAQAREWKRAMQTKADAEAIQKRLQETEEFVQHESWEDSKKAQEFNDRIARLRADLSAGRASVAEVESAVRVIESDVDEEKISEEVRRQTVTAIVKQLRAQEFIVGEPQVTGNGGETYVKITAQQPSGRRTACKIDLRGKIQYRFDHYEGMTCLKDIQMFNVDLERICSVKLSDERVLWQNPDRLTRDENNAPTDNSERGRS